MGGSAGLCCHQSTVALAETPHVPLLLHAGPNYVPQFWLQALSNQVLSLSQLISVPFLGILCPWILRLLYQTGLQEVLWHYLNSGYFRDSLSITKSSCHFLAMLLLGELNSACPFFLCDLAVFIASAQNGSPSPLCSQIVPNLTEVSIPTLGS